MALLDLVVVFFISLNESFLFCYLDLQLAGLRDLDETYQTQLLTKAKAPDARGKFWAQFVDNNLLTAQGADALYEWTVETANGGDLTEFYGEASGKTFALGVVALLQRNAAVSATVANQAVDIAVTILNNVAETAPDALALFHVLAQEAYTAAKANSAFAAKIKAVRDKREQDRAHEDAIQTQLQISGQNKQYDLSPPQAFPAKDLAQYGQIFDNGVYTSLLAIVKANNSSSFQQRKALHALTLLINKPAVSEEHPIHQHVFAYLTHALPTAQVDIQKIALLDALRNMLVNKQLHYQFVTFNGFQLIKDLLIVDTKQVQPLYLLGYAVWLLSYNPLNDIYFQQYALVEASINILRTITREKVVRIFVLAFLNLAPRHDFVTILIGGQFHKILPVLQQKKWKGADVTVDVNKLADLLQTRLTELSSFDQYVAELKSGALKKTPVHSERFWRFNAVKFDSADPNEELLRRLVSYLGSSDAVTQEMAAYDIGEFARFHPSGKKILVRLGAKTPLMTLMGSSDVLVAQAALLATQKLLIHKWDEMVSSSKAQGLRV